MFCFSLILNISNEKIRTLLLWVTYALIMTKLGTTNSNPVCLCVVVHKNAWLDSVKPGRCIKSEGRSYFTLLYYVHIQEIF